MWQMRTYFLTCDSLSAEGLECTASTVLLVLCSFIGNISVAFCGISVAVCESIYCLPGSH